MRQALLLGMLLFTTACGQSEEDAIIPIDQFATAYANAICENQHGCCGDDYDSVQCKQQGRTNTQARIDALAAMQGAVYRSAEARTCVGDTAQMAANCQVEWHGTSCDQVFLNADAGSPDGGSPSQDDLCAGDFP